MSEPKDDNEQQNDDDVQAENNPKAEPAKAGDTPPTIDQLTEQNTDLQDKLLRALAEVENMRQRNTRDLEETRRYAIANFARDLLDVADNLRRALDSAPAPENAAEDVKNLLTGITLTERSLLTVFEKAKIAKVMPEKGTRFDHKRHQAMFEVPTTEFAPGHVAEVMQPGYVIADRLLRPALVGVSKQPAETTAKQAPPAEDSRGAKVDTQA